MRRPRRVGARCGASVGRSALNAPTTRRCSCLRPHRATRCAPCGRSAQTSAMSQLTNALRAGPQALRPRRPTGAPHRAPTRLGRRASGWRWVERGQPLPMAIGSARAALTFAHSSGPADRLSRATAASASLTGPRAEGKDSPSPLQSVAAGAARWGRFGGAEERSGRGGARSALRELTHRHCLSGAPAGRAASLAMRLGDEYHRLSARSAPDQAAHEPPPGCACRDARQRQGSQDDERQSSPRNEHQCQVNGNHGKRRRHQGAMPHHRPPKATP